MYCRLGRKLTILSTWLTYAYPPLLALAAHAFAMWETLNQSSPPLPRNMTGSFVQPNSDWNEGQTLWSEEACFVCLGLG